MIADTSWLGNWGGFLLGLSTLGTLIWTIFQQRQHNRTKRDIQALKERPTAAAPEKVSYLSEDRVQEIVSDSFKDHERALLSEISKTRPQS